LIAAAVLAALLLPALAPILAFIVLLGLVLRQNDTRLHRGVCGTRLCGDAAASGGHPHGRTD
jgi:hypothetical protein